MKIPDGFFGYPWDLVWRGWEEWKETGVMPDPARIARIDPRWDAAIRLLNKLVRMREPKRDDGS